MSTQSFVVAAVVIIIIIIIIIIIAAWRHFERFCARIPLLNS